ncbi:MAG: DUF5615 family PIN-like protein [Dehalococcoidia bacterium]
MQFYLDEDQSPIVATIARRMGVDIVSTGECGRNGKTDEQQLLFAAEQGRAIVTRNYDDFHRLTTRFQTESKPHAGVLFVPSSFANEDFADIARAIARYAQVYPDGMAPYMVDYLSRTES